MRNAELMHARLQCGPMHAQEGRGALGPATSQLVFSRVATMRFRSASSRLARKFSLLEWLIGDASVRKCNSSVATRRIHEQVKSVLV